MNDNIKSRFKTLDFIFLALLSSQLLSVITFYFIKSNDYLPKFEVNFTIVKIAVMILNLTAFFTGKFLYNMLVNKIKITEPLEKKIDSFRTISLFRLSLFESVNLMNCIAFLFTGDNSILLIFFIILILFFAQRPSANLFIRDFSLTEDEKNLVLNESLKL